MGRLFYVMLAPPRGSEHPSSPSNDPPASPATAAPRLTKWSKKPCHPGLHFHRPEQQGRRNGADGKLLLALGRHGGAPAIFARRATNERKLRFLQMERARAGGPRFPAPGRSANQFSCVFCFPRLKRIWHAPGRARGSSRQDVRRFGRTRRHAAPVETAAFRSSAMISASPSM